MKPGILLIIAGAALAVLITVQVYLVSGLYDLKKESLEEKYRQTILEGFLDYQKNFDDTGFDSAFYYLDMLTIDMMDDYFITDDDSSRLHLNRMVISQADSLLREYDHLTPFLKGYVAFHGLDTNFVTHIQLAGLFILYPGEEISLLPFRELAPFLHGNKSFFLVNRYLTERDFLKLSFGYYLDVTRRQQTILREMTAALLLSLLSVLITAVIFFITLRNLMRHRQLSMMKTDFINNMAHELRTPLTIISVAGSTLAGEEVQKDPAQVRKLSSLIRQQNKHLSRLIDQLLDINIWERDQITLQKNTVAVGELLQKIIEAFRLEHNDQAFDIYPFFPSGELLLLLDEFYFSVAINNLLSNALKYGGERPEIRISLEREGESVIMEVSNNGPEIPPADREQLFGKFFRGQHPRPGTRGLGLGLYYVRKIIEMHGGTVVLKESTPDRTTFRITLPLQKNINT